MLTAPELAAMRTTAGSALPGTAVIQSSTFTSDGGGGGTTAWTAAGTVACRLAPIMGNMGDERVTGGQIAADAEFVVTLPFNADVDVDDRLVVDGEAYNVEAVRDRSWNVSTRVEVARQV